MMNNVFLISILVLLTTTVSAGPRQLTGRVSEVPNGDTIMITDSQNQKHRVYLLGIEAPEAGQRFARQSRDYLERILFARNNQVKVIVKKFTRAKNIVGTVFAAYMNSDQYADINGMMVMAGYAWANPKTSRQYVAIEKIARNRKAGLWKQKNPVAPWLWRKQKN